MGTSYPGGQDSFQRANPNDPLNGPSHAGQHDNAYDAIEAIETELGTNPSGSDATVAARLSAIEAGTNLATGAVTSAKIADGTITSTDVAASTFAAFGTVGNLLTANQASGASTSGIGIGGTTLARVSDALGYDGYAIEVTRTGAGNGYVVLGGAGDYLAAPHTIPCKPGEVVSAQVDVWSPSDTQTATLKVRFFNSSGGSIVTYDRSTALSPSAVTLRNAIVAPSGAAYVAAYVDKVQAGSGAESFRYSRPSIHRGPGGQWQLPGVPVPGQSRIAVNNAVDLSGTGAPEGVITAAPGSTWLQTDSTVDVKGWIRWIKATGTGSTGWIAGPEADTGKRLITPNGAGWGSGGALYIRRRGASVEVNFDLATTGTSGTVDNALLATAGFRPAHYGSGAYRNLGTGAYSVVILSNPNITIAVAPASGNSIIGQGQFTTPDPWPSSLPGTAA